MGRSGHAADSWVSLTPHAPYLVPEVEPAMWNDRLRIAERVERDWQALSVEEQGLVRASLEKIDEDPILGAPLLQPLRGLWSYRVGHLRILYRIAPEARYVVILAIVRAGDGRVV